MIYTYINSITGDEIKVEASSQEQADYLMRLKAQFKISPHNQLPENYLEEKLTDGFKQAHENGS